MVTITRNLSIAAAIVSLYGLAYGYGSAFEDAPPAQSPAYGRGYYGSEAGRSQVIKNYSSATRRGTGGTTRGMGGPPSGGSMGGSSSGGR